MLTLYTKDNCPACVAWKAQTTEPFIEIKIGKDISREEFMAKFPGVLSVPHIVKGEENDF